MARSGRHRRSTGELARRDLRGWGARGTLALAFAILGYMGSASSLANVVAKIEPATAYAIAPGNGVIMARYAEDAFARDPKSDGGYLPARLARRALLADPTAAGALTVLGIQAQLRGDTAQARRIFEYSTTISRRELRPRIWAIEEAVNRGDIEGALRNYDIALRTSKEANNLLFPTLAAALAEPRIRSELIALLATRPAWEKDFLPYIASSAVEPEGAVALFNEGERIGLEETAKIRANLVNALASRGKMDGAWDYYLDVRPGARRDRSRDPRFSLKAGARTLFDWQIAEDSRLAATISDDREAGWLEFAAPPGVGGEVVSQTQVLPPGSYRFDGRSREIKQPERSRPYWVLTCNDGRELGRVPVSNSEVDNGRVSGRFIVPTGCPMQRLSLMVKSSDDIMGVSGQIRWAQLIPAQ